MDKSLLENALNLGKKEVNRGEVAQYIPELRKADPQALGVSLYTDNPNMCSSLGDCDQRFTLQSISKVFTLILALQHRGTEAVFDKVGMEPTGDPFNSVLKLETADPAKPLNPMINAGAIAVTAQLPGSNNHEKIQTLVDLLTSITGSEDIQVDGQVYASEKATGDRNRALGYFLKDMGIIHGDVEEILDLYFRQCAITINCCELAKLGYFLACHGTGAYEKLGIKSEHIQTALTFMVTCGMYNASGEFAIKVGIPAKSGVSGGILAAVPNMMGIGIYGPALDEKGNSIGGKRALEYLSQQLKLGIF